MTFTPGLPFDGQSLGSSKPLIRGNFTNYSNLVSQDHIGPNGTGQGKHNKSTYVSQTTSPATLSTEVAMYSRTIGGVVQLCLQRSGAISGAADIQMTAGTPQTANTFPDTGLTFLPGGFVLMWSVSNSLATGSNTITFSSKGLPNFPTRGLTGWAVPYNVAGFAGNAVQILGVNQTSITIGAPAGGNAIWYAIGN